MEQQLRRIFDQIMMGAMPFDDFLEHFQQMVTVQAEKEVQEFDECLAYLVQPEIKVS